MAQEIAGPAGGTDESQALRLQLAQTRSDLASKLDALQKRMTKSVEIACDTVDETVHTAKLTALDAVLSIKHILNLRRQIARRPWTVMGVVTCIGAVLAQRSRGPGHPAEQKAANRLRSGETSLESESDKESASQIGTRQEQLNVKQWLHSRVQTELARLQVAAIGAGVNICCGLINRLMPQPDHEKEAK